MRFAARFASLVVALSGQASHQLTGLAAADCLLRVTAERGDLPAGSLVEALPLPWSRGHVG